MGLLASCSAEVLSAALLLLLFSSTALSQCPAPVLPPHSSLKGGGDLAESYAVDTTLRLQCIPGYDYLPGTIPTMRCLDTSKWSDLPALCQGRRCPVPHLEDGRIVDPDDLRLGEEITLACDYGFRIIGGNTRRCALKSGKVDWDRELPFCERIPCIRPPLIANGRYDPNPLDTYDAGSTVLYRCDPDYSLIGKSAITCIVEENGVDGRWDPSPPECKTKDLQDALAESSQQMILEMRQLCAKEHEELCEKLAQIFRRFAEHLDRVEGNVEKLEAKIESMEKRFEKIEENVESLQNDIVRAQFREMP